MTAGINTRKNYTTLIYETFININSSSKSWSISTMGKPKRRSFIICHSLKLQRHSRPINYNLRSILQADIFISRMSFYAAKTDLTLMHFLDHETLPYDSFSPHQDLIQNV